MTSLVRWLRHDDGCPEGPACTCGLTVAAHCESEAWFEVSGALRAAAFLERRGESLVRQMRVAEQSR